jgi:hypothetical protein
MADYFYKEVDKRSREELINFLQDHPRYSVMNSWNFIKTFSNKVKVHYMDLPKDVIDRAFDLVCGDDTFTYRWNRQLSSRLGQFEQEQGGTTRWGLTGVPVGT